MTTEKTFLKLSSVVFHWRTSAGSLSLILCEFNKLRWEIKVWHFVIFSAGPPDKLPHPTKPLPTVPPARSHPPVDPRKHDRQTRPPRLPTGDKPMHPNAKPDICDGGFNTLAILRREMFVFKVRWLEKVEKVFASPSLWFMFLVSLGEKSSFKKRKTHTWWPQE